MELTSISFHPAINRVKEIIESGELGKLKNISGSLRMPAQMRMFTLDDIRFDYKLGGGNLMDMGCKYEITCAQYSSPVRFTHSSFIGYPLMMIRYVASANPTSVLSTQVDLFPENKANGDELKKKIDIGIEATLAFPNDVTGTIKSHFLWPGWGPLGLIPRFPDLSLVAECEGGTVQISNFIAPSALHKIEVIPKGKGKKRVETAYVFKDGKGEDWWPT